MQNLISNKPTSFLAHKSLNSGESIVTSTGAISVNTGACTGRSPGAKKYVKDKTSLAFDKDRAKFIEPIEFEQLKMEILHSYTGVYSQDVFANHDAENRLYIRAYTSTAWQSVFVRNMFTSCVFPDDVTLTRSFWHIYSSPAASDKPKVYIDFSNKEILIAGTKYAGEIKKSIFTVLNALLPSKNILPMHCSVNVDPSGENPCVFFGLSGTGKTTLSSEENRRLIGDDEHAWSPRGLHNFEGGCYAKVINLSEDDEPEIYKVIQRPGSILENVVLDARGRPDFSNSMFTENTRASYDIGHIASAYKERSCGHPRNIVFLTCDAFGILPPVSRLDIDEMREHFILGYTAKVAGTESGVKEPAAVFSFCYGEPFMPLEPSRYADLLEEYVQRYKCDVWLVNTGWTGGPYGVGERISISATRSIIVSIHDGSLAATELKTHEATGLKIPSAHPVIGNDMLIPESAWDNKESYCAAARNLHELFDNRKKELGIDV